MFSETATEIVMWITSDLLADRTDLLADRTTQRAASALLLLHAQQRAHFFVEETLPGTIGLDPLAVNDELRNRTLADVFYEFVRCARSALDIDFVEGEVVLFQKALGFATIATPERGVNSQIHFYYRNKSKILTSSRASKLLNLKVKRATRPFVFLGRGENNRDSDRNLSAVCRDYLNEKSSLRRRW